MREPCDNEAVEQIIENLLETIPFKRKELFSEHLQKCLHVSNYSEGRTFNYNEFVTFKVDSFFKGFGPFQSEYGKNRAYQAGVEALRTISEEFGLELEEAECFIWFHLRKLGKFKVKEDVLRAELKAVWKEYQEYALDDQDLSYALKNLMRSKCIDYRKRNIQLKKTLIIRYRQ